MNKRRSGISRRRRSRDADSGNAERLSLKRYKALGIGAVVFAAIMGVAVTTLLPLKEFVPIIIRVENATGAYDVKPAGEKLDVGESRNEKIVISDVAAASRHARALRAARPRKTTRWSTS